MATSHLFAGLLAGFGMLLTVHPCGGQTVPGSPVGISDFLTQIGGSQDPKTIGKPTTSPDLFPLQRNADEIAGYRFYSEKAKRDAMHFADEAIMMFGKECAVKGGELEPTNSPGTQDFYDRVVRPLTTSPVTPDYWRGGAAICVDKRGRPLGGVAVIVHDTTRINTRNPIGIFMPVPTTTAIYAFNARQIKSSLSITQKAAASKAAADAKIEDFRKKLAIGSETSCGTVIEIRGPVAEVALRPTLKSPNGATVIWSKIEGILPRGSGVCDFGY